MLSLPDCERRYTTANEITACILQSAPRSGTSSLGEVFSLVKVIACSAHLSEVQGSSICELKLFCCTQSIHGSQLGVSMRSKWRQGATRTIVK